MLPMELLLESVHLIVQAPLKFFPLPMRCPRILYNRDMSSFTGETRRRFRKSRSYRSSSRFINPCRVAPEWCNLRNPEGGRDYGTLTRFKEAKKEMKMLYCIFDRVPSQREKLIKEFSVSEFTHNLGKFRLHTFRSILDERIHYVLSFGKWTKNKTPMIRVQTANVVSDVLGYSSKEEAVILLTILKIVSRLWCIVVS